MPPLVPWQDILLPAVLFWAIAGAAIGLAAWSHHQHPGRRAVVIALVCAGVVLVALSVPIAMMAYRQYQAFNTRTYGYYLDVHPNGTAPDAIVVPIPTDEILVSGMRVASGVANWSIIDSGHGRGLYVAFARNISLEATYSAYGPSRNDYNRTPTMRENATRFETNVWIYHAADSQVRLELSIDWCHLVAYPTVGWRTYPMQCDPPP